MSQIDFRIALHRKLLYASVPCLPVLTWEMTHDLVMYGLPLRYEKLHRIGSERFWALFTIILQDNTVAYSRVAIFWNLNSLSAK